MGKGGTSITMPEQPAYSEGMAEALKAQVELLTGKGEFKDIAPEGLAGLVPLEERVRALTTAADTEALETAMLGERVPPKGTHEIKSEDDRYEWYVRSYPESLEAVYQKQVAEGLAKTRAEWGKAHWEGWGKKEGRAFPGDVGTYYNVTDRKRLTYEDIPREGGGLVELAGSTKEMEDGRQPGFDEDGNFLGLTSWGEDLRQQAATTQRSADIADVEENLSRFQAIMEEVSPATTTMLDDAFGVIQAQGERLIGTDFAISKPDSMKALAGAINRGDTTQMSASVRGMAEQLSPETAAKAKPMTGYSELGMGGLRGTLQAQAQADLDAGRGLSPRQRIEAEQSARRGWEARGLIRDPEAVVSEVESVMEAAGAEEARRRAFASGVVGQEAGLRTGELGRGMAQEEFNIQNEIARQEAEIGRKLTADEFNTLNEIGRQQEKDRQGLLTQEFNIGQEVARDESNIARQMQGGMMDVGTQIDQERLNEQLRQQGILGYMGGVTQLAGLEQQQQQNLDPFGTILNRPAGTTGFGMGQQAFAGGQYGLTSAPQYINPEAGLGYISNMAANQANMYGAQQAAAATKQAGMFGGLGALGGGIATGFIMR